MKHADVSGTVPMARRVEALNAILQRRRERATDGQASLVRSLRRPLGHLRAWWRAARLNRAMQVVSAESFVKHIALFEGDFELRGGGRFATRMLMGGYEADSLPLVNEAVRAGDHVLDIGANIGLYTVLLSRRAGQSGRVLAVEPTPVALRMLRNNLARNTCENTHVFEGVVSSQRGECELDQVEGAEEYSAIGNISHPDVPAAAHRKIRVAAQTLDGLVEEHDLEPSFIKVDVEGAEGLVFSGGGQTLAIHRPIILSELDDRLLNGFGTRASDVVSTLVASRYQVFDASTGHSFASGATFTGDVLALPEL